VSTANATLQQCHPCSLTDSAVLKSASEWQDLLLIGAKQSPIWPRPGRSRQVCLILLSCSRHTTGERLTVQYVDLCVYNLYKARRHNPFYGRPPITLHCRRVSTVRTFSTTTQTVIAVVIILVSLFIRW